MKMNQQFLAELISDLWEQLKISDGEIYFSLEGAVKVHCGCILLGEKVQVQQVSQYF